MSQPERWGADVPVWGWLWVLLKELVPSPWHQLEQGSSVSAGEGWSGTASVGSVHFPPTCVWYLGCAWSGADGFPHSLASTALGLLSIMAVGTGEHGCALDPCTQQRDGCIHTETSLGLLTLPAISISFCIWAILDRSWVNFSKMLLTCCLTYTMTKPKGGTKLISLSVKALRALMGLIAPGSLI